MLEWIPDQTINLTTHEFTMDGQASRCGRNRRSLFRSTLAALTAGAVVAGSCAPVPCAAEFPDKDPVSQRHQVDPGALDGGNTQPDDLRNYLGDGWTNSRARKLVGVRSPRRNHFMDIPLVSRDAQSLREIVSPQQPQSNEGIVPDANVNVVVDNPLAVESETVPRLRRFEIDLTRNLIPLSEFVADDDTINEALEVKLESEDSEASSSEATSSEATSLADAIKQQDVLRRAAVRDGFALVGTRTDDASRGPNESEQAVQDESLAALMRDGSTLLVQPINPPTSKPDAIAKEEPATSMPLPDLPLPESRVVEPKLSRSSPTSLVAESMKQPIIPAQPPTSSPMRLSKLNLSKNVRQILPPVTTAPARAESSTKTVPRNEPVTRKTTVPKTSHRHTKAKQGLLHRFNPFRLRP